MSRVVIVTGASRSIGAAIAVDLARDSSTLVLAARDERGLETTADQVRKAGGRAVIVKCDVTSEADREKLVIAAECEGPIDVLVNNAGVEVPIPVVEQSVEDVERQLHVNLHAPILLTQRVLPAMIVRGKGSIVIVSSMSGKSATPFNSIYAATKHGLNGFVSSLRFELEGTGVQAGVVCPGFVAEFGMWADTGVKAPALLKEVSPKKVVAAVRKVLAGHEEVLVTPGPVRPLLALSELFPSSRPVVLRSLGVVDALKKRSEVVRKKRQPL